MTRARQVILLFVLLLATWLIWSGYLKPLLIAFGVASCALVVVLAARMDALLPPRQFNWLRLLPRLPGFWVWLAAEVVKSNLQLAAVILDRRLPISPRLVTIDAEPASELGQAILGNCITLTPGTVTLDDHAGKLQVHCITTDTAAALEEGSMNRRVAALTGPEPE